MKRKIFSKLLMGAFLIASVSMFVSCKDYDDDISANTKEIEALKSKLNSEISGVKSDLTAQLSTVNGQIDQLKKSIETKADASALATKAEASELTSLEARVAVLESQIAKLGEIETALSGKADASALETLQGKVDALTGAVENAVTEGKVNELIAAATSTLDIQGEALKVFQANITKSLEPYVTTDELGKKGYLTSADLKTLTDNVEALQKLMTDEYVAQIDAILKKDLLTKDDIDPAAFKSLKEQFQSLNDSIDARVNPELSAIVAFVNKKLTSLVLKPNFYWEGIEGIEAPFLWNQETYLERGDYEFTYKAIDPAAGVNNVKVWVKTTMGWGGKDGKAYGNRELAKYVVAAAPAHHMDAVEAGIDTAKYIKYSTTAYGAVAEYHINPSIADLEGAGIGFYDHAANVYTRGDADPSIKPQAKSATFNSKDSLNYNYNTLKNGILTVPFTVDYWAVLKYFLGWTASQTDKWEGYKGKVVDEKGNSVSWGIGTWEKVTGAFDKDAITGGDEYAFTGKLPFVSLQVDVPAKEGKWDKYSVNSDYAVVVPGIYDIVALADIDPNTALDKETFIKPTGKHEIRKNHLYETVGYGPAESTITAEDADEINIPGSFNKPECYGAIPMPATHEVVYNDEEGIDLLDFVRTHYDYITFAQYGTSKFDETLDTWTKNPATAAQYGGGDLFNKLGLSYKFTVIDYTVGTKITSESAHIQQYASKQYKDKDGNAIKSRFVARSVKTTGTGKDDFETIWDKTATREAIDREPLVRVDLYDANGKIIRYGYIKLRIVDATTTLKDKVVTIPLADIYMNCGDEAVVKWHQIENLILAQLGSDGMTKNEFEKQYKLDVYGGYKFVPFLKPENFIDEITGKTAKDLGDTPGVLYTRTWQAKRYYQTSDGSFATALDEYTTNGINAWTNTNNHFGEVWYTPEDNTTAGHHWDEQTNVLMWNFFQGNDVDKNNYKDSRTKYSAALLKREQAGNMDKEKYNKMMSVLNINYDSKGVNEKDTLSTVIRFINKNTNTSVYVILSLGVKKVHFEYGVVDKKDWSHWFQFNNVKNGETDDKFPYHKEFDTRLNPFKPSNVAYRFLEVTDLNQKLTDHWMDPAHMVSLEGAVDKGNFSAFAAKADAVDTDILDIYHNQDWALGKFAPIVTFQFVYPSDGSVDKLTKNSRIDSNRNKGEAVSWDVKGASGTVWRLAIRSHANNNANGTDAIVAIGKSTNDGKSFFNYLEEIAYIDGTDTFDKTVVNKNKIFYHGLENNAALYPAATDLINLSGAYNAWGDPRFTKSDADGLNNLKTADFFKENINEAFTAYLKINVAHECYDPLISKQYFNLRFHRPINVVGKKVEWSDMVLADNTIAIRDLVEMVDWNTYPLVSYNASAVKARDTEFGMDFPAYANVYAGIGKMKAQNAGIPYEYYGIQELAVRYDEIRTDHAKLPSVRTANHAKMYTNDYSWIIDAANSDLVKSLPSMTSPREYTGTDRLGKTVNYRTITLLDADGKIVPFDLEHAWNHSTWDATKLSKDQGNTQYGRLYYNNDASDTQLFHIYVPIAVKYNWGNIAYDDKLGDPTGKKLDNDYTQKVWAIITVQGTH